MHRNSAFVLRRSMVSEDYLSAEVCNAVLFIGKAMRVERVDELTQRYVSLLNDVNASGIGIEPTSFHALIEGMRQEACRVVFASCADGCSDRVIDVIGCTSALAVCC